LSDTTGAEKIMARSRNIKPGFFLNEDLVELPFEVRLLFIGLWCLADREGRLENRPKKIKMNLFPGDELDMPGALLGLARYKLITIYSVGSVEYIQVNNFNKHQNPHVKEQASVIPAPCDPGASLVVAGLIPDSLIPDPGSPTPSKTLVEQKPDDGLAVFQHWQAVMNHPRSAYDSKRETLIKKHLKNYTVDDCKQAIDGCASTPHNMGENKDGRVYDSFELIFRDSKHIDDYMRNFDSPPDGGIKTLENFQDESKATADRIRKSLLNGGAQ
jgi:hypothetical protein